MRSLLISVIGVALLGVAFASPSGAPVAACETMTPAHGTSAQTGPSPYQLQVSAIVPSVSYNLTVSSTDGSTFRGFMIQARDSSAQAVGTFDATGAAKATDCPPSTMNTATHVDRSDKTSVSVTWNAPAAGVAGLNFQFSVVQSRDVFWVNAVLPVP